MSALILPLSARKKPDNQPSVKWSLGWKAIYQGKDFGNYVVFDFKSPNDEQSQLERTNALGMLAQNYMETCQHFNVESMDGLRFIEKEFSDDEDFDPLDQRTSLPVA